MTVAATCEYPLCTAEAEFVIVTGPSPLEAAEPNPHANDACAEHVGPMCRGNMFATVVPKNFKEALR